FNYLITEEREIGAASQKIISFLCDYTKSDIGVLYLNNDSAELFPSATYGVKQDILVPSFIVGKGKIGQAAAENKIKIFEDVPDEHLKIKTGLSEMTAATIIVIPIVFDGNIIGVLELCSREKYQEHYLEFLKEASEKTGIFIHSLQSQIQTKELLYETQNQAEELETQ